MSVMYCTAAELASFLQKDLDTSTANLAIQVASQLFSARAATMFTPTTTTWVCPATGVQQLQLPFRPVSAVSAVRIITASGVTTTPTDWRLIRTVLYRILGFGAPGMFPPDSAEVDLTHGHATCPDDAKGAVLETAAAVYQSPDVTVAAEQIDDYQIRSSPNSGGVMLTPAAAALADLYRGLFVA